MTATVVTTSAALSKKKLSGRPACWNSKVIQIQSDHLLAACFSAGCCHGTDQSDLLYPSWLKKARAPSGRPPLAFSRSPLNSLLAGFLFFFFILDVALLHQWPPHLWDGQVNMVLEESLVSFFSPPVLSSSEERPGCYLKALLSLLTKFFFLHVLLLSSSSSWEDNACTGDDFALLTHWVPLTVSLASHLLDNFSTMVWLGLTTCWRRTSERILSVARCMFRPFVSRGFTKSWVGQVALRSPINRHAVELTVSLDDQGTRNVFLNWVQGAYLWSAPSSFEIPALRVPRYRLAPVDCHLVPSVTGKAPC